MRYPRRETAQRVCSDFVLWSGIGRLGLKLQARLLTPYIRAVNYHGVPEELAEGFEAQLRYYARHFVSVSEEMLSEFLRTGIWGHDKPGLILSFDDGLASHWEVVAPRLADYGLTGWFFVPSGLIERGNGLGRGGNRLDEVRRERDQKGQESDFLTLDEVSALAENHVVGSHTRTHTRLGSAVSQSRLIDEIRASREELEVGLGRTVRSFCWVGGETESYSAAAAEVVRQAGYDFAFMTNSAPIRPQSHRLKLQRTNVEADFEMSRVEMQVSGLMDVRYYRKRKRVNRLTDGR